MAAKKKAGARRKAGRGNVVRAKKIATKARGGSRKVARGASSGH